MFAGYTGGFGGGGRETRESKEKEREKGREGGVQREAEGKKRRRDMTNG